MSHEHGAADGQWTFGAEIIFRIDAPDEEESNPRASAQQALDECFAACREEAWADSSGDPNEWFAAFKEDPFGPAHKSNLIRVA